MRQRGEKEERDDGAGIEERRGPAGKESEGLKDRRRLGADRTRMREGEAGGFGGKRRTRDSKEE